MGYKGYCHDVYHLGTCSSLMGFDCGVLPQSSVTVLNNFVKIPLPNVGKENFYSMTKTSFIC